MADNQGEKFYHCSYVYEGFISAVSLSNNLMKILVGFCIFNRVIKKKIMVWLLKWVFLNKQTNVCGIKCESQFYFYNFTLRNSHRSISYIKKNGKMLFPKMRHFSTAKTVANKEKVKSFSDSVPSN